MNFQTLPRVFPEQPIWGCAKGAFTFVITEDAPGEYSASAKVRGATAFDGTRHDLGGFCAHKSFSSATTACETFYKSRNA